MAVAPPLGWSLTSIHPEVVLGVALLAALYAWAARRVPVRPVEAVRFLGALAALLVAAGVMAISSAPTWCSTSS